MRPPRTIVIQVPRWRRDEVSVRCWGMRGTLLTSWVTRSDGAARTVQSVLGRYAYRHSRIIGPRAWREECRFAPWAMGVARSPLRAVEMIADAVSRGVYPRDVPRLEAASDASGNGMGGVWFNPNDVRPGGAGADEDSWSSASSSSFRGVEEWEDEGL